jgi:heme exporter protein D
VDEAAWGALALTLSLLGGIYTWYAYRRRGLPAGLRGAGLTLLPVAAWLTDTLRLLTRIGDAVGDWAARLAFSPSLWLGVIVAAVSIVLLVVGGVLERRGIAVKSKQPRRARSARELSNVADAPTSPTPTARGGSPIDEEMAEIEAILRKRGIT